MVNLSNASVVQIPLMAPEEFEHEHLYSVLRIVQLVLLIVIFFVGAAGNLSVMALVWRKGKRRRVKHYFMFHLAFADSLVIIICLPVKVFDEYRHEDAYIPEELWFFWTKIISPTIPFSVLLSIFTMVCMAWERHRAIVNPFKKPVSKSTIFKLIAAQWLVAIAAVSPITYVSKYNGEYMYHDWASPKHFQIYTIFQTSIQYFVPLTVILVYHIMIIKYVRHVRKNITWLTRARESRKILRKNLKLYRKCILTIFLFAILIFPEMLFTLWSDFGNLREFEHYGLFGAICSLCVIIESAINPSIYANFDQVLLRRLTRCLEKDDSSITSHNKHLSLTVLTRSKYPSIFTTGSGKCSSEDHKHSSDTEKGSVFIKLASFSPDGDIIGNKAALQSL